MQQGRNLSSLPLPSKRSGLNRPRAQIFSCQRPGLTAARLCLYRIALCNPGLPASQKRIFPVIKQLSIEAVVLSFVPMDVVHFSYFTVLLLYFLLIINFNGLVTSFRKIQSGFGEAFDPKRIFKSDVKTLQNWNILCLNQGNSFKSAKFCCAKLDYSIPNVQSKFTVGTHRSIAKVCNKKSFGSPIC